jgi:RNA 3'-terminal phosphate cyclase
MDGLTPLQVADALEAHAAVALKLVAGLRPAGGGELALTLRDYQAMAHLGNYYAEKIRGAAELSLYDATGAVARQRAAVAHLKTALAHWRRYAATATAQYKPQLLNRVGYVDLNALTAKVDADIAIAERWQRSR